MPPVYGKISVFSLKNALVFLGGSGSILLMLLLLGSQSADAKEIKASEPPFELGGIFLFRNESSASIHPRDAVEKAIWLAPGQSWGNLDLIEINSQESQVKIRHDGKEYVLELRKASNTPIPFHLESDTIEEEGRLVRKMRAPTGRGRSKSSGTISVAITQKDVHTSMRVPSAHSNSRSADADEMLAQRSAKDANQRNAAMERPREEWQFPARRASIKEKAGPSKTTKTRLR